MLVLVAHVLFELAFLLLLCDGVEGFIVIIAQLLTTVLEHGSRQLVKLLNVTGGGGGAHRRLPTRHGVRRTSSTVRHHYQLSTSQSTNSHIIATTTINTPASNPVQTSSGHHSARLSGFWQPMHFGALCRFLLDRLRLSVCP